MQTHPRATKNWQNRRRKLFEAIFKPRPRLTVSQWADRLRKLSTASSGEPGQWSTDRVAYLREPMDAVSDPEVHEIVMMKSARVGFTEGLLGNAIGYHIHQDPCSMLMVQPSIDDAKSWSKENLAPMLSESPVLMKRVGTVKVRDSENTILSKMFSGGMLRITGAISPRGFRRFTCRKVYFDEVDGYPASAGSEGDPITLGKKRAQTIWNRQYIYGSTPTLKGFSRIEALFELSDRRFYQVPCTHCGHEQRLQWGGPETSHGLKYDTKEIGGKKFVIPGSVGYLCGGCGAIIAEIDKWEMIRAGRWVPSNPGSPVRGYHINALYSLFVSWELLVQEWLDAQGSNELLQVFINTVLGETWEERGEAVSAQGLEARAETYVDVDGQPVEVPTGVGILTAGVDVQSDRLELVVRGWGLGEESWLIGHHRIYGDPKDPSDVSWSTLETMLTRAYRHAAGGDLRVMACCIDSGYRTDEVYAFVKPRQVRGIYASKGIDQRGKAPLSRASRANRDGVKLFTIGTYSMKDVLFKRLKQSQPGPGYMHFCRAEDRCNGADAEYYAQFGAEKVITRKADGKLVREYKQVRDRNEAIDLEVLALAALHTLGAAVRNQLPGFVKAVEGRGKEDRENRRFPEMKEASRGNEGERSTGRGARTRPVRRVGGWATSW